MILCVSRLQTTIPGILGFLGVLVLIFVFFSTPVSRLSGSCTACGGITTQSNDFGVNWTVHIESLLYIFRRAFDRVRCSPRKADLKASGKQDALSPILEASSIPQKLRCICSLWKEMIGHMCKIGRGFDSRPPSIARRVG
jgi:hypothetical protein